MHLFLASAYADAFLCRFLSKDATDRAMDSADIGTLKRLNGLLNQERAASKEAESRADQFAEERNDLAAAVGRMEGKIEALTSQVGQLTERVTEQSEEIHRLLLDQSEAGEGSCFGLLLLRTNHTAKQMSPPP